MKAQRIALLRRAVRAHLTRSHREKWLAAVAYLRQRELWIIDKREERKAA